MVGRLGIVIMPNPPTPTLRERKGNEEMNKYIGHPLQLYGIEEMRLVGGKGDGMRMLNVRNGKGLEFMVLLDRCGDIVKLSHKGDNFSYFAPCGYVSSKYYDSNGTGFLKSFSAGFFTTCGLWAVGVPCTDVGEELPMHGTISNTPCENVSYWIEDDKIHIKVWVRDAALFARKLILEREYVCPINENIIYLTDKIKNVGSETTPLQVLYHCNIGYPLLSENSVVNVPSNKVIPRNEHAAEGIENCLKMEKPQNGYIEKCYYHILSGEPTVSIYNPDINKGLKIKFDTKELPYFTEWKMMGEYEYVLGLEPGNCYPDGRNVMREKNMLEFLEPNTEKIHNIVFEFVQNK